MWVFVAIEIINKAVINLIREFQDSLEIEVKLVKTQNFHFTLQFLEEISQNILLKIT